MALFARELRQVLPSLNCWLAVYYSVVDSFYIVVPVVFIQFHSFPPFFCEFQIQQRFHVTIDQTKDISEYIEEFLSKLTEESKRLGNHAAEAEEIQMKSIAEFQKVYEVGHTFD